jgi:hypothetical protein
VIRLFRGLLGARMLIDLPVQVGVQPGQLGRLVCKKSPLLQWRCTSLDLYASALLRDSHRGDHDQSNFIR